MSGAERRPDAIFLALLLAALFTPAPVIGQVRTGDIGFETPGLAEGRTGSTPTTGLLFPRRPIDEPILIENTPLEAGTTTQIALHSGQSFLGSTLETVVIAVRGRNPGPTLCLTAGIHGDELNGTETVRRVVTGLSPEDVAGTILALPIANVHGFRNQSRLLPDRRDLDRHFPGSIDGSAASRIAHAIFDGLIRHCDALVDLHSGSFRRTSLPHVRGDFRLSPTRELARGLGTTVAIDRTGPEGSLEYETSRLGVPSVVFESGESLRLQPEVIEEAEKSILRLLDHLEMRVAAARFAEREPPQFFAEASWLRVNHGGVFLPAVGLSDVVDEGEVLATVYDPLGGRRAAVRAARRGKVIGMALPQVVLPGFAAFWLGRIDSGEAIGSATATDPRSGEAIDTATDPRAGEAEESAGFVATVEVAELEEGE